MRKMSVLSVLLLFTATGLSWAQFWKSYTDEQRQKVAESYWLAGKQYQAVGKTEEGGEYTALARVIWPELDPSAIHEEAMPSAAELLAQGRTTTIGAGAQVLPSGALHSFFLRFVSALAERDAESAASFLDGSIYLTGVPAELTREQARSQMAEGFQQAPAAGIPPSSMYDLASAVIAPVSSAQQSAWGESYTYSINALADLSSSLSFWEPHQRFFIHKEGPDWFIFAEGTTPPPLTWKPRPGSPVETQPPAAATEAATSAAIIEAFNGWMGAILNKDADGALSHMSGAITFLRMHQTVSREELKTTLQGYFDNPNFTAAQLADAYEQDSIFVQPVASPVAEVTAPAYELNVKSKADLSGSIPFWSDYQKYYFVKEGENWLIFAIL